MSTKLTSRHDIKKNLKIELEFNRELYCEYRLYGKPKWFKRPPLAMANLLKKYGFVEDFKVVPFPAEYGGNEVYVEYTPADDATQYETVQDFTEGMGQFLTLLFIAEFEREGYNRREIAEETAKAKARIKTPENY